MKSDASASAPDARLHAIGLICAAIFSFAMLDASGKYLVTAAALPIIPVIWFRFVTHTALTCLVLGPRRFARSLRSARPGLQILRSILLFATTGFNFAALQYLQLDQAATIFFLTPFIVALLAGPLLDEWIGWRRMMAIMVGFSGVLLVTRPGFGGIHWAVSYSFAAMLCYACYTISTRYLARHDPSLVTQVYSPLAGVVLLMPLGIWLWEWPAETWHWGIMVLTGLFGGFGHYLLILAHRRAPAPILAPFTYTGLVSQSLFGYLVFSDLPSVWTLAGGAVIIGSGLYLLYREHAAARSEMPASAALTADLRN
jgi:drug/metabolite transporter (DMT)-like permease